MGTPTVAKSSPTPHRTGVESLAGQLRLSIFDFTFSTSYATGGEAFDPAALRPNEVKDVQAVIVVQKQSGHLFEWDPATKLVKAYWSGTASAVFNEVAAATNLSVTPGLLKVLVVHR